MFSAKFDIEVHKAYTLMVSKKCLPTKTFLDAHKTKRREYFMKKKS